MVSMLLFQGAVLHRHEVVISFVLKVKAAVLVAEVDVRSDGWLIVVTMS